MDHAISGPSVILVPSKLVVCPGESVTLTWAAPGLAAGTRWSVGCDQPALDAGIGHRSRPWGGIATIVAPGSGALGSHVVRVSAALRDGTVVATGTASL